MARPGYEFLLIKALYGARQAGEIWGNAIHKKLLQMFFIQRPTDPRLYYFVKDGHFIILCVVVYDIALASNSKEMIRIFKENLSATFDVNFYGELKSFIRWTITRSPSALFINQTSYCERLLSRFNMENCNPVHTQLQTNVDLA